MRRLLLSTWVFLSLVSGRSFGALSDVTHQTMAEVVKIAQLISAVQPYLDDTKLMEYGLGIYRASKRYDIDPAILISITQQETGFRENLPEGRAGEIGICQIRKMWLKHPQFRKEFGTRSIKDLKKPAKSFLFAAWLLRDLKSRVATSRTLPFWSYYNSVKFENRFKYFLLVNRNIATLRKYTANQRAAEAKLVDAPATTTPKAGIDEAQQTDMQPSPAGTTAAAAVPSRAPATKSKTPGTVPSGRWISDAMEKLKEGKQPKTGQVPGNESAPQPANSDRQASNAPAGSPLLRAASAANLGVVDDSRLEAALQD